MRKIRRVIRDALRRITGVSTPVGGVSWTPSQSEREALRKLVIFLEDRRALFDPYNVEATLLVEHSVQEIRAELTRVLQTFGENSKAGEPMRMMRAACQRYLTKASAFRDEPYWHRAPRFHGRSGLEDEDDGFILALGELRGVFGVCLQQIASSFGIEVHGELARLLPLNDNSQG